MKSFFILLAISFGIVSKAQFVGLTNPEIKKLKHLIRVDGAVQKYYASYKTLAQKSLNQNPNPVDTIVSEGHLATDPKKIRTQASLKDVDKMYALAITYRVGKKRVYLNKLTEFLYQWVTINKPQGNPINDTKFEDLLTAYDLTKEYILARQRTTIDNWLIKMADEEIKTGSNKTKTTSFNNWNSHRLKVIGTIAYILNIDEYKRYIDTELPLQVEKNLLPDGTGHDFLQRDALHYHIYTLEPLITLATILKRATGKNFYNYVSPSGASINKSINFLIPFVTGEKTHGEFAQSKSSFDKKRADNNEPGYEVGASFKPSTGVPVLVQAAYFDPVISQVIKKVTNNIEYANWQAVLIVVKKLSAVSNDTIAG